MTARSAARPASATLATLSYAKLRAPRRERRAKAGQAAVCASRDPLRSERGILSHRDTPFANHHPSPTRRNTVEASEAGPEWVRQTMASLGQLPRDTESLGCSAAACGLLTVSWTRLDRQDPHDPPTRHTSSWPRYRPEFRAACVSTWKVDLGPAGLVLLKLLGAAGTTFAEPESWRRDSPRRAARRPPPPPVKCKRMQHCRGAPGARRPARRRRA